MKLFPTLFASCFVFISLVGQAAADTCVPWLSLGDLGYADLRVDGDGIINLNAQKAENSHPIDMRRGGVLQHKDQLIEIGGEDLTQLSPEDLESRICQWRQTLVGGSVKILRGAEEVTAIIPPKIMANHWWLFFLRLHEDLGDKLHPLSHRLITGWNPEVYEGFGIRFAYDPDSCYGRLAGCIDDLVIQEGKPSPARDAGIQEGDRIVRIAVKDEKGTERLFSEIHLESTQQDAAAIITEMAREQDGPFEIIVERGESRERLTFIVKKMIIHDGRKAQRIFKHYASISDLDDSMRLLERFSDHLWDERKKGQITDGSELSRVLAFYTETMEQIKDLYKQIPRSEMNCLFYSHFQACSDQS